MCGPFSRSSNFEEDYFRRVVRFAALRGAAFFAVRLTAFLAAALRGAAFFAVRLTAFFAVRLAAAFFTVRFAVFLAAAFFTVRFTVFLAAFFAGAFFAVRLAAAFFTVRFTAFFAALRGAAFLAEALRAVFFATATIPPVSFVFCTLQNAFGRTVTEPREKSKDIRVIRQSRVADVICAIDSHSAPKCAIWHY
jgi:hypothetical protein